MNLAKLSSRLVMAAAVAALPILQSAPANAWGARGHELIAEAAMSALGPSLPSFLRTKNASDAVTILSRELDRSRGAGLVHAERDSGHFFDLDERGFVHGLFPLAQLPRTRADLETALVVQGYGPLTAGYLPYAMIDGWQQLAKDFAYWRASKVGATKAKTAADRAWFAMDMKVREQVIIRDIGVWGHYVADASQPQHVSEHHAGWPEKYPDPMTYPPPGQPPEIRSVHNYFEGPFVKANIRLADVKAAMKPYSSCNCEIWKRVPTYLEASWREVEPLYRIVSAGGLRDVTPEAKAFTAARMAAGATEMRDLIEEAWKASATMAVGYPNIPVADIESGKVILTRDSYGFD